MVLVDEVAEGEGVHGDEGGDGGEVGQERAEEAGAQAEIFWKKILGISP